MTEMKTVRYVKCSLCKGRGKVKVVTMVKTKSRTPRPPPLQPISDALKARLPTMSRQSGYQAIRIEHGLCAQCGQEPISPDSKRFGLKCLKNFRERAARKVSLEKRGRI